ncbi:hypothetical protein ACFY8C_18115 [Streptomyces flavochromogenes]|uniref:Uncharacterized protein n=1 Tax=Streptomyces flavochromogenes TaxID=68199 RepID=A0ABW6XRW8_9ACTN
MSSDEARMVDAATYEYAKDASAAAEDGSEMTAGSERTARGRKAVAPVLAIGVLVVGAHLWSNSNLFADDEVCGGLVSTDSAATVFPSSGRVSDRDGLHERAGDRLAFTCVVESSSFLPGADTEHMRVSASRERGDFPFADDGRWPNPAGTSFFSGGSTGAVGRDHGWVLLPGACTTNDGPAIVEGYAPEGSDPPRARPVPDRRGQPGRRTGRLSRRRAPRHSPHPHRVPGLTTGREERGVRSRRSRVPRT